MNQNYPLAPPSASVLPQPLVALLLRIPPHVLLFMALAATGLFVLGLIVEPVLTVMALAGLTLGIPLFWLIWTRPEFGLLGVLFVSCSFIPINTLDIRLPFGGLDMRDITVLGMVGLLFVREVVQQRGAARMPWWVIAAPLLIFLFVAVLSAMYSLLFKGTRVNWVFEELRPLIYYTTFFSTAWAIRQPRQLAIVLVGAFLIVDATAIIIILQQFAGPDQFVLASMGRPGAIWEVWDVEGATGGFGSARIIPPGHVLVYLMTIVAFCLFFFHRQSPRLRAFYGFQFVYLNLALLLTYARAQWIASVIALIIVCTFLPKEDKTKVVRYVLVGLIALMPLYLLVGRPVLERLGSKEVTDLVWSRFSSIFTPDNTLQSDSLQWRVFETEEGFRSVSEHPLIGVGLGNEYREATINRGEIRHREYRLLRFMHNNYLYITVKMGLIGFSAFALLVLSFLLHGWNTYFFTADTQPKRIMLAALACFCGVILWSITQPHFMSPDSAVIIGFMMGLVASLRQIEDVSLFKSFPEK